MTNNDMEVSDLSKRGRMELYKWAPTFQYSLITRFNTSLYASISPDKYSIHAALIPHSGQKYTYNVSVSSL
jgi:hypothetical protein